jgi:lipoprotein-anchoring transpeptidase ErfK/SrfK
VVVAAGALAGCGASTHHAAANPAAGAGSTSTTVAPRMSTMVVAPTGWSMIATTKGTVAKYRSPGARPDGVIPATWYGGVSALAVIAEQPGWLQVRLATRPNESTAWVRTTDVAVTSTPYRIVINLASAHLELLRQGRVIMDAPAGVGTPADPTPTGQYFVALFEQPPSAGYGPFVMVTSAHSDTITDWEQSGDALIAIHGPLGADTAIGTTGAAVSHGCVRLHLADQAQLRQVPAGTPITITSR